MIAQYSLHIGPMVLGVMLLRSQNWPGVSDNPQSVRQKALRRGRNPNLRMSRFVSSTKRLLDQQRPIWRTPCSPNSDGNEGAATAIFGGQRKQQVF